MSSESVQTLVIITPKPGKLDELISICEEGAKHHKDVPACTRWLCSREINSQSGEESLILVSEWTSMEELMDHSRLDASIKTRDQIMELASVFEFKMSKVFAGFGR